MFSTGVRAAGLIVGAILAVTLIALGITYAFGGAQWLSAPFRGDVDKRERTVGSGAFRIATYEEYFDLCAAAQTAEQQEKELRDELAGEPKPSADRAEKIRQSITAVRSSRAESINTYNSKANQEHRAAFHDANLPSQLDVNAQETRCAA